MKKSLLLLSGLILSHFSIAQSPADQSFKDRWVINTPSVETLPKGTLDVRFTHRFGDFAGDNGGWKTFYGLEDAADVALCFEYGIAKHLTTGLARSKGSGPLRQLMTGMMKYQILSQDSTGNAPLTMTLLGMASASTSKRSEDPNSINYFEKFAYRMIYHTSLLVSRKFSDRLSFQLSGGWTHRNTVPADDENNLFHAGLACRIQVSKMLSLIGDVTLPLNGHQSPFSEDLSLVPPYYIPLGLGLEFNRGGHVFQLNFSNSTGIMPTDYIPYTNSNWADGEFRIGFTVSRMFDL
jgi:hypothetical protein